MPLPLIVIPIVLGVLILGGGTVAISYLIYKKMERNHKPKKVYREYSKEDLDIEIVDKIRFFEIWVPSVKKIYQNNEENKIEKQKYESFIEEKKTLIANEKKKKNPNKIAISNANEMIKSYLEICKKTDDALEKGKKMGGEAALKDVLEMYYEYREAQDVIKEKYNEEKKLSIKESIIVNFVSCSVGLMESLNITFVDAIEREIKKGFASNNQNTNSYDPFAVLNEALRDVGRQSSNTPPDSSPIPETTSNSQDINSPSSSNSSKNRSSSPN